jgi:hypothetical protein
MFFGTELGGTTIRSVLLSGYNAVWAGEDGSYELLQEQIKQNVKALAAGELQVSLAVALTGKIREMFNKYLAHMVCYFFEDQNACILLETRNSAAAGASSAAGWTDHYDEQGTVYDYNEGTGKTMWENEATEPTKRSGEFTEFTEYDFDFKFWQHCISKFSQCTTIGSLPSIVIECLQSVPVPPLAQLAAPLQPCKVPVAHEPPQPSNMFPFFAKFARMLDAAATEVLAIYGDYEGEDFWEIVMGEVVAAIRISADHDGMAQVATKYVLSELSDSNWQRYLTHFITRLLHSITRLNLGVESLQHQVIRAWLTSQLDMIEGFRVVALHVVAQWYEDTLVSVATSIKPLAELMPAQHVTEKLIGIIDGGDDVHIKLTAEMVAAFYELMLQQIKSGTRKSLQEWADGFGRSKLQDISTNTEGVDFKQLDAMLVVYSAQRAILGIVSEEQNMPKQQAVGQLAAQSDWTEQMSAPSGRVYYWNRKTSESSWTKPVQEEQKQLPEGAGEGSEHGEMGEEDRDLLLVRNMVQSLRDLAASMPSSSRRLELVSLWEVLKAQGAGESLSSNTIFSQRLLDLWLGRLCSEADSGCMINDIIYRVPQIAQQIPLLETVLFGQDWHVLQDVLKKTSDKQAQPLGSLLSWLEFLDRMDQGGGLRAPSMLEACINSQQTSYQPHWAGGADEQVVLAHSFFHLTWKWLLLCHSEETLSQLASVAQSLETSHTIDAIRSLRLIALTATRVLIINRLADRILSHPKDKGFLTSGDETDRVMGQLEAMKGSTFWGEQLAYEVCVKKGDVDRGLSLLEERADTEEKFNMVVATWLRRSAKQAIGDDSRAWFAMFKARYPPLVMPLTQLSAKLGASLLTRLLGEKIR